MYNKYHSRKCTCGSGHVHDSMREACRCNELHLMLRAGMISDLRQQVKYTLIPAQREPSTEIYTRGPKRGQPKEGKIIEKECAYYADFVYNKGGKTIVEDTKGMRTEVFKIKKKLMLKEYGIRVQEI